MGKGNRMASKKGAIRTLNNKKKPRGTAVPLAQMHDMIVIG